jgi:ribonucleotide monophosphatase NagD (HAD superfamily)
MIGRLLRTAAVAIALAALFDPPLALTARPHPRIAVTVPRPADAMAARVRDRLARDLRADFDVVPGPDPDAAAAVVIGDAGDELSYRSMDVAFRLVRGGAELLAMHRNPWWLTPKGETLDAGGFVVGLEFATGVRAHILGKPSPEVFRQAVAGLTTDLGERLPRSAFAMVGDDLRADVAAAQRVGMKGILVLSGKTGAAEADRARRGSRGPDGIGATLADVVAALD